MLDAPRAALEMLRRFVGEFEPDRMPTEHAADLVTLFAQLERICVAGRLLAAARAAQSDAWARAGHRSAGSWMADVSRSGLGEAIGAIETAQRLAELPATSEALRRGELSGAQAKEIAAAAAANPEAEAELLEAAGTHSFKELKDRARKAKAAAASQLSEEEREERIRRWRYLRHWSDEEGAFRMDARLTPVDGAQVLAALEARARKHFEEAHAAAIEEPQAAYLADALVSLCAGGGEGLGAGAGRQPARVHLRADIAALRRGALDADELCEIAGVGPVSVTTARSLVGDSFLTLFVRDGIDVHTIVHVGRTVPTPIRRALGERDPYCVVPGCGATRFLQIDHWQVDFCDDGPTELWNLCRLCPHHHRLKTRGDFELLGGPGKWEFRARRRPPRSPTDDHGGGDCSGPRDAPPFDHL